MLTVPHADKFLEDLSDAISVVEEKQRNGEKVKGTAAIYGMAATLPDTKLVNDVAAGFLDALYIA